MKLSTLIFVVFVLISAPHVNVQDKWQAFLQLPKDTVFQKGKYTMSMSRLTVMSCLLLLFLAPAVIAQTAPANTKTASIRKLLVLMEAGATFRKALQTQADQMKKIAKDVPARFWDELLKEIDTQTFLELLVPIYDKHLSEDDVEALIAFYQTPSGKKLISVLPQIMAESGAAGEKYGAQVSERVIKRMQADGTFPTAPPAGQAKPPQP